jgi:hypothetical protein
MANPMDLGSEDPERNGSTVRSEAIKMRKKAETIPPVDSPSHSGIDA